MLNWMRCSKTLRATSWGWERVPDGQRIESRYPPPIRTRSCAPTLAVRRLGLKTGRGLATGWLLVVPRRSR